MFQIVKHMFHILNPSLSAYLFSFMLGHLHKSCRAEHEDHFIFYQLCLIPSLSCSNWGIKLLFQLKHGNIFHVSDSCFKEAAEQLATSTLLPTARPTPCLCVRPHSSWPPPLQAGVGCLGVSGDLSFLLLSTKALPPFFSSRPTPSPPWALQLQIHHPRSTILQFALLSCSM
jgi:hypothetical protein